MKLSQLIAIFQQARMGTTSEREVSSLCFDSRKLESDCVFVAIRGGKHDGHDHLAEAARLGAAAVVVEDDSRVPSHYAGAVIKVSNSRAALNDLCSRYYQDPAQQLYCVGVTGTNGKTTITNMLEAVLGAGKMPTGVIGTINHHLGEKVWETEMTTPDPLSFQARLREFVDLGAKSVALEASSHALSQSRVDIPFNAAIFTNLTRDHLDYHRDMEDYFQAKARLFTTLLVQSNKSQRIAVINADDAYGRRLVELTRSAPSAQSSGTEPIKVWTYGQNSADFNFTVKTMGFEGSLFTLKSPVGTRDVRIPMAGAHNIYNAVSAIAVGVGAGLSLDICAQALENFRGVSGRLESVENQHGVHVFVDYAHTDDALTSVLKNLAAIRQTAGLKSRLLTVFGCGGDRDRGKRPLMMKAALAGSDFVIVTSDNPRTEEPGQIIAEALAGAPLEAVIPDVDRDRLIKTFKQQDSVSSVQKVLTEIDRRAGIELALKLARPGDVVLIAGKGHETYQQIGLKKFPFSDVKVVKEYFACLGK